jgi:hypothetical protein
LDIQEVAPDRLRKVVDQTEIPVLIRRGKGNQLRVRLPYHVLNKSWLGASGRNHPVWDAKKKVWEVPQAWFNDLVNRCLQRYGRVYVIQPYRAQEVCARACWEAERDECQCSCMGMYHGSQSSGAKWREVSDAFATRWGARELACRLITAVS